MSSGPLQSRCSACGCFYYHPPSFPLGGCTRCGRIAVAGLRGGGVGDAVFEADRRRWREGKQDQEDPLHDSIDGSPDGTNLSRKREEEFVDNIWFDPPADLTRPKTKVSIREKVVAADWVREQDAAFAPHDDTILHLPADPTEEFNVLKFDDSKGGESDHKLHPVPENEIDLRVLLPVWRAKVDREARELEGGGDENALPPQ